MEESMVMPTLIIDPEFQNKIPPLMEEEYRQLEENILDAGEVWEPIVTWNGVIVDGHNRYKIVQEHPEIKWRTREVDFPDKWAAFDWMYKNQLGRRNLTDEQRKYLMGKLQEARKNTNLFHGNQYTKSGDCGMCSNQKGEAAVQIAKELGVSPRVVYENANYAIGIDAIREQEPETADEILKGQTSVKKKDVMEVAKAKEEKRAQLIEEIKKRKNQARKINKDKPREMVAGTKENKELNDSISASIAELYDTEIKSEYTLDMFLTVIRMGAERYAKSLRDDLEFHKDLLEDAINRDAIATTIQESIIDEIEKIKESIENEE